jgi:hypothetical protein
MQFNPEDLEGIRIKHLEGPTYEYKVAFNSIAMSKYIETICAFLNTGGGFLIFGVSDDLKLVGLPVKMIKTFRLASAGGLQLLNSSEGSIDLKDIDRDILLLDSIVGQRKIFAIDKAGNNLSLNTKCIVSTPYINKNNKVFIVVTVNPIPDMDYIYVLPGGEQYQRSSASNYYYKHPVLLNEHEVHHKIMTTKAILEKEYNRNVKNLHEMMLKEEARHRSQLERLQRQLIEQTRAKDQVLQRLEDQSQLSMAAAGTVVDQDAELQVLSSTLKDMKLEVDRLKSPPQYNSLGFLQWFL